MDTHRRTAGPKARGTNSVWLVVATAVGASLATGCPTKEVLVRDGGHSSGGAGGLDAGTATGGIGEGGSGSGGAAGAGGSACAAGGSCGTTCNPGTYECSTGTRLCNQKTAAPGTACGSGQVCDGSGVCVACAAGGSCGTTCKPGTYDCSTGMQVCSQKNAAPGTSCGGEQVCDGNGTCAACMTGAACGSACNPGMFNCSTGTPVCANQVKAAAGTTCGTNQVCDANGGCIACTKDMACGTTCAPGQIACTTGAPVCKPTNATAGTSCGTNMICNGSGACVVKTADGGMCSVNAECQNGNCSKYATTGASLCCATGSSNCGSCVNTKTDGTNCGACGMTCGAKKTCQNGACTCAEGLTLSCGSCGSWSFESGTESTEGWSVMMSPTSAGQPSNGATNAVISSNRPSNPGTGSFSLVVPISISAASTWIAGVGTVICTGAPISVGGYTLSGNAYFDGPTFPDFAVFEARTWTGTDSATDAQHLIKTQIGSGTIPIKTWFAFTKTFETSSTADRFSLQVAPNGPWSGTMYLDDIKLKGL